MTDKVVFVCVVLIGDDSDNWSWSEMYVNVEPEVIRDDIAVIVQKFPDMLERSLHMKRYGFDDEDDDYLDNHFHIISEALHG